MDQHRRGQRMAEVDQFASPSAAEPSEVDQYDYISSGPNAGLCDSITYLYWNSAANNGAGGLVYGKQVTYTYYGTNDPNGLPGDLQTITTQYAVGTTPAEFGTPDLERRRHLLLPLLHVDPRRQGLRPRTEKRNPAQRLQLAGGRRPQWDARGTAAAVIERQLRRLYSSTTTPASTTSTTPFHRVTLETVFGKLRTETFAYTDGHRRLQSDEPNAWAGKTVETLQTATPTRSTPTTSARPSSTTSGGSISRRPHTYTFYEYDSYGDVTLQASSSAIARLRDGQAAPVGAYSGSTSVN